MTTLRRADLGPIVHVVCCRTWPVFAYFRIGRCGECGTRPVRV